MRKSLTALAVAATAFVAPMLASGTAYAAEVVTPQLPAIGSNIAVDATAVTNIVNRAIGGGCTTTFAGQVAGQGLGGIVTISGLIVTVNGYNAEGYAFAQEGHTVGYVICLA